MQTRFFILLKQDETWFWNHITHTILTIFFSFLQTGTHYFAKWGEVTSWILKSAELLSVFCFALRDSASSAQQRAAKLSSAVHESSVELRAQWTKVVFFRPVRFVKCLGFRTFRFSRFKASIWLSMVPSIRSRRVVSNGGPHLSEDYDLTCFTAIFVFCKYCWNNYNK